jgi:hypothetical protein
LGVITILHVFVVINFQQNKILKISASSLP